MHDDLVQRVFSAPAPDMVWLTDITEHPTVEGKLYCCSIKDVFSNRIVGYAFGPRNHLGARSACPASAIARRRPEGTVVVHSDRGGQFRSRAFRAAGQGERARRIDGPRLLPLLTTRRWSRSTLPLQKSRARTAAASLAHPRRTRVRDHHLDRTHLQPPTPSTPARQTHPRRLRARLHPTTVPRRQRAGSMISHNHRQPDVQQSRSSPITSTGSRASFLQVAPRKCGPAPDGSRNRQRPLLAPLARPE